MLKQISEKLNGEKKTLAAALIAAVLATIPYLIQAGEVKGNVESMKKDLDVHLNQFTPDIVSQYHSTKTTVAVHDAQIQAIQKSLDEIKEQNKELLRIARRRNL